MSGSRDKNPAALSDGHVLVRAVRRFELPNSNTSWVIAKKLLGAPPQDK